MIHTVKSFGIVNKAEIDVFLELSCFFEDPKNPKIINVGEGMERREPSYTTGGGYKLVQSLWRTVWRFLKKLKAEILFNPTVPLLAIYPGET